jgi:hypothetical protein
MLSGQDTNSGILEYKMDALVLRNTLGTKGCPSHGAVGYC